jgi:hypothetical protein
VTPAERLVDALLAGDAAALRALRGEPGLGAVVEAGLARLEPDTALTPDELVVLTAVSGRPGLSAAELTELVGPAFSAAASLVERGLVTSRRFDRTDCWVRTALGAAVLRASR